jgi:hypothetical protein
LRLDRGFLVKSAGVRPVIPLQRLCQKNSSQTKGHSELTGFNVDPCFRNGKKPMTTYDGGCKGGGSKSVWPVPGLLAVATIVVLGTLASARAMAAGSDLCNVISSAKVGQAVHATVVRAEVPQAEAGCEYSIKGTPANSASDHAVAMTGALGSAPMDPSAANAISTFSKAVLGSASAKEQKQARHPGEIPVLAFTVSTGNAQQEMATNRQMLGRMSSLTTVTDLGDDAFETSQSVLMVRKGDKFIRFIYTQCNCASSDVIALARQVVAGL